MNGVQPTGIAFAGIKARRRALDQCNERLLQVPVSREEHPAPTPQPVAIELRHLRQGVVSAVVVVAVGGLHCFNAGGRVDAAAYELGHFPSVMIYAAKCFRARSAPDRNFVIAVLPSLLKYMLKGNLRIYLSIAAQRKQKKPKNMENRSITHPRPKNHQIIY